MATEVTAIVKRCREKDAKPGRPWCIYKHDSPINNQPKGWPKTYESKEKADRGLRMMKTFGKLFKITAEEKKFLLKRRKRIQASPSYSDALGTIEEVFHNALNGKSSPPFITGCGSYYILSKGEIRVSITDAISREKRRSWRSEGIDIHEIVKTIAKKLNIPFRASS